MLRRGFAAALIAVVAGFALVADSSRAHAVAPIIAAVVAPIAVEGVLLLVDGQMQRHRPTPLRAIGPGGEPAAARGIGQTRNGARITGLSTKGKIIAGGAALALGSLGFRGEDYDWEWDDPDGSVAQEQQNAVSHAGVTLHLCYHRDDSGGSIIEGSRYPLRGYCTSPRPQGSTPLQPGAEILSSSTVSSGRITYQIRDGATGNLSADQTTGIAQNASPTWSNILSTRPGDQIENIRIGVSGNMRQVHPGDFLTVPGEGEHEPRRLVSEATCVNSGGNRRTVTAEGSWYTSGHPGPFPSVQCAPEERMAGLEVYRESQDSTVPNRAVLDMPIDESELDPSHPYYDCMVGAPCELMLYVVQENGTLVSCNVDPAACVGWEKRQDREAAFVCMWGPYTLDLAQCAAYQGAWDGSADLDNPLREDHDGNPQLDDPGSGPSPTEGPIRQALSWAFVPTKTPELFQEFQQEASGRPPVSIGTGIGGLIGGVVDGWKSGGACGQFPAMWDDEIAGTHRLPCDPAQTVGGTGVWAPIYVLMQGVIVALGAWSLWALARRSVDAD